MSVSREFYIGAYLQVQADPIQTQQDRVICRQHGLLKTGTVFCPQCGEKAQEDGEVNMEPASIYTLLPEEEWENTLMQAEIEGEPDCILIGNDSGVGDCVGLDEGLIDIEASDIATCVARFSAHYQEVIGVLRQRSNSLEVKFGAFVHYT